jgi:hypothetical protein
MKREQKNSGHPSSESNAPPNCYLSDRQLWANLFCFLFSPRASRLKGKWLRCDAGRGHFCANVVPGPSRNIPSPLRLLHLQSEGDTVMNKIIVATIAAFLATSSVAFGQTVGGDGVSSGGAATGTGATVRGSTGSSGTEIADPSRRGAEPTPRTGEMGGSGTPGSRTTGAGMAPSDRATGSKSGQ